MKVKKIIIGFSLLINLILAFQLNYYYKQSKDVENVVLSKADMVFQQFKYLSLEINNNQTNLDNQKFRLFLYTEFYKLSENSNLTASLEHIPSKTISELRFNLALLNSTQLLEVVDDLRQYDKPLPQKDKEYLKKLSNEIIKANLTTRPFEDKGKSFNESLKKIVTAMVYQIR